MATGSRTTLSGASARSFRVAFGEQRFEENLRFVTESLGVKDIRDYS